VAWILLAFPALKADLDRMDDTPHLSDAPPGWAEALDESLAELAAGVPTVPAETVHQRIRDTIARIEAKKKAEPAAGLG
jgi:hypothetical protein